LILSPKRGTLKYEERIITRKYSAHVLKAIFPIKPAFFNEICPILLMSLVGLYKPENGDYHLKSKAGRWDPSNKTWVQDNVESPCIDAGDPSSDVSLEPETNGGIINMGAYGGTAEASLSSEN